MQMRMRWIRSGGHVHVRVFTRPAAGVTFAKNGELVFSQEEWAERHRLFRNVEFLHEGEPEMSSGREALRWHWLHPGSQKTGFWQAATGSRVYRVREDEGVWKAANGFEQLGRADTEAGGKGLCEAHYAENP